MTPKSRAEAAAKEKFPGDSPTAQTGRAVWVDGFLACLADAIESSECPHCEALRALREADKFLMEERVRALVKQTRVAIGWLERHDSSASRIQAKRLARALSAFERGGSEK